MTRARAVGLALSGILAVTLLPRAAGPQEIYQAVVLDLTVLEVHVMVSGARGDEELRCLLRTEAGHVRVAGARPVASGLVSGRITHLSLPLPLLGPGEREFAVAVVRHETVVAQTPWRPLFPR